MTTTQTTNKASIFKFKVGDDLQVINKVILALGLTPSNYVYNAKEGIITTNAVTKEQIERVIKTLGFEFLLGPTTVDNKQYKTETITEKGPYVNINSLGLVYMNIYIRYQLDKHSDRLTFIETKIDHVAKTVTVTANVRIPTFNDLDYKVALILTNFSYVTSTNNKSTTTEQEAAYDELYKLIDKLIDKVSSDFNKSAPPDLKTFVKLFL